MDNYIILLIVVGVLFSHVLGVVYHSNKSCDTRVKYIIAFIPGVSLIGLILWVIYWITTESIKTITDKWRKLPWL